MGLDGGAKKRKKKVYTKPKKVPHKHKKVKLAVLKFYKVDGNNKVVRLRKESPVRSRCLHGHALQPVPLRQVRGHVLVRQVRRVQVDAARVASNTEARIAAGFAARKIILLLLSCSTSEDHFPFLHEFENTPS